MQMKKKYTDAQSYFQDWAQVKRKEVQDMEKSMRENPLYQKEVNPKDDDETWSERFHFILRKGLSEKEWKALSKEHSRQTGFKNSASTRLPHRP